MELEKRQLIDFIVNHPNIDTVDERRTFLALYGLQEFGDRIIFGCNRLIFSESLIVEIQKEGKQALLAFLNQLKNSDQIGDEKQKLCELYNTIEDMTPKKWKQFKGSNPPPKKDLNEQESLQQKALYDLGDKVNKWIEFLDNTLEYKCALPDLGALPDLDLQLKELPKAVKQDPGFDSVAYNSKQIPSENINNEFKKMGKGKSLLILGDPGSGKTTILLKLLKELRGNLREDESEPVPVVLNLSSWKDSEKIFDNWLVRELHERKLITNSKIAKQLIDNERLILLLDGLDEVNDKYRRNCLEKLNDFILKHSNTEIIVCSRIQEYEEILGGNLLQEDEENPCDNKLKFQLQKAFYIQPFEPEKNLLYLQQESVKPFSRILIKFKELRTPLVIFLIMKASIDVKKLPQTKPLNKIKIDDLLEPYVNCMLERRDASIQESYKNFYEEHSQTKKRLRWLAIKLKQVSSNKTIAQGTIFQIEQMQPAWLPSGKDEFIYRIATGLTVGLILGLVAGFYFIYYSRLVKVTSNIDIALSGALGLKLIMIGVLPGLISGFIAGLVSTYPEKLIRGSVPGIIFILFLVLTFNLLAQPLLGSYSFPISLAGLFGGAAFSLMGPEIQPVETWQPQGKNIIIYSLFFAGFGIVYVLARLWLWPDIYKERSYYAFFEVIVFIIVGVVYGGFKITKDSVVLERKEEPNHGIKRAARYTVISFTTFTLAALIISMIIDSIFEPVLIFIGLTLGLLGALVANQGSGIICIQHFILRVILWRKGDIPWNYAKFLNYATERVFLRRFGGAYFFIHGKIMDYFSQMELNSDTVSRR